jgi:hypothetical protein
MLNTPLQQSPYLRVQRQFPNDNLKELANQSDHAYIDIASKVNARTIGIFAVSFQIITGEQWYLTGEPNKQQTLRQVYEFTTAGPIPHGINFNAISQFTKPSGSFTDGTNWYGAIYASNVAIAGQITFYITPIDIVILSGAGAPTIVNGTIILEWLSNF